MFLHKEIQVCTDCRMLIANGDTPTEMTEKETYDWLARIVKRWGPLTQHVSLGDEAKDDGFSARPCEHCDDRRGGDRYHAVVLCQHAECGEHEARERLAESQAMVLEHFNAFINS